MPYCVCSVEQCDIYGMVGHYFADGNSVRAACDCDCFLDNVFCAVACDIYIYISILDNIETYRVVCVTSYTGQKREGSGVHCVV